MLKPRIARPGGVPYGGRYELNLPELGLVGSGTEFSMLVGNIKRYRHANGLPNGLGLEDEIEREVCARYKAECVETDVRVPRPASLGLGDIVEGTKTMLRFKLAGSPVVSEEEASRRAGICVKCPNHQDFQKPCAGLCQELKTLVIDIIGSRSTPHDINLKSCLICKCFTQASVWLPVELQTQGLSEEQRLQFRTAKELHGCWKG